MVEYYRKKYLWFSSIGMFHFIELAARCIDMPITFICIFRNSFPTCMPMAHWYCRISHFSDLFIQSIESFHICTTYTLWPSPSYLYLKKILSIKCELLTIRSVNLIIIFSHIYLPNNISGVGFYILNCSWIVSLDLRLYINTQRSHMACS